MIHHSIRNYARTLRVPSAYLIGGTSRYTDVLSLLAFSGGVSAQARYHAEVCATLQVRHAFSYSSGRAGLFELLRVLKVGRGDQVILPGYTCVVIPAAIIRAGATPVYVDIDPETLNTAPADIAAAVTPRTKAILAQHTFGLPCEIGRIQELADRHGAYLIEDGAHALGAKHQGRYCGQFGVASMFSTEKTKMISTEKGGVVTTNDDRLAAALAASYEQLPTDEPKRVKMAVARWVRYAVESHPRTGSAAQALAWDLARRSDRFRQWLERTDQYDSEDYEAALQGILVEPFPARLAPVLAYLGRRQIRRLEADVRHRNRLARALEGQAPMYGWQVPRVDWLRDRPSFVRYPFLVDDRERWILALRRHGVQAGTWLNHPIHPEGSAYRECGYQPGMCPRAESVAKRIVNLPVHSRVGEWLLDRVELARRSM